MDARQAALKAVRRCLEQGLDVQQALDQVLEKVPDPRNRSLATELCYGYLRFRGRIDFVLDSFLTKPAGLPLKIRTILGLAGYELFVLDRVPSYAAVSRAVEHCRAVAGKKMAGLVNAVLRRAADLDFYDPELYSRDNPPQWVFLSRYYSCPEWIVRMWLKEYGPDLCREFLRQSLDKPGLGLRRKRGFQPALDHEYIIQSQENSLLVRQDYPGLGKFLAQGQMFRQSFSGQMIMHQLQTRNWPEPVWDMCAGRGGKTFFLLDIGKKVLSSDVSFKRITGLRQEAEAQGAFPSLFMARGEEPPLRVNPGTILIDAPCSGLGVLSRRPDIKWKRRPMDVPKLAGIQAVLVDSALKLSGPGTQVAYITCTLSRQENEAVISGLKKRHDRFKILEMCRTDPSQSHGEFFFGALLESGG
ncbi:MAG: transcription antitermination factor NusB [Desulfonatronovibrionaceae bacterium]